MATTGGDVEKILEQWRAGEAEALEELLPLVYTELRQLAVNHLRKERDGHTLQPTALVHEVYVRLTGAKPMEVSSKAHFFSIAARTMRQVLVDHARRQQAGKRISAQDKVSLDNAPDLAYGSPFEVLALHDALKRLAKIHPRQAKLVELRYFGGLKNSEAAEVLEVSSQTIDRDWQVARLWLRRRLSGQ